MNRWRSLLPMVLLLAGEPLRAEEPLVLPPLLIEATRSETQWSETPAPVSSIAAGEMRGEAQQALDEWLQPAPGLFTLNRYNLAQGLRPSIRGFGARAGFGVRGIRVMLDGIPLTLPDGQTELDALDLGLLERVEVLRGPASALYGNAAGGVISLYTRDAPPGYHYLFDAGGGELGARQLRAEGAGGDATLRGLGALAWRQQDGFRRHSAADSAIATGKLDWTADAGRLRLSVNALDVASQDPGALTAAEARNDRRAAAPNNLRFDAGEEIRQQRFGLLWESGLADGSDYRLRAWGGRREFANRLPFTAGGQSSFERDFGGFGAQLTQRARWLGLPQRLVLGLDVETQRDERRRHDNLDGGRGAETLRQRESARGAGLYLDHQLDLGERWLAALGLRHDRLRFEVEDGADSFVIRGGRIVAQTIFYRLSKGSLDKER